MPVTKKPKTPPPPAGLSPAAADVWAANYARFRVAPEDCPIFEIWCESFARWRALLTRSDSEGAIVTVNGQPTTNPALIRADREAENVRRLSTTLTKSAQQRDFLESE